MGKLAERRIKTQRRIQSLRDELAEAKQLIAGKACVYATGSFGRGEASEFSDLDVFIVGLSDDKSRRDGAERSRLTLLDEICVKAELIEAIRRLKIPDFDGDGRYLSHHSVHDFTKTLGTPEDDVTNTFTARLLLLLESSALLEELVYQEVIDEVIAAYWRDYEDHKSEFIPAFLANDILRLWRTFCVNYEARTETQPAEKKAKRKLKNYKLKHSRLLTCFSAILFLLAIFERNRSVSPPDVKAMIALTPTQRLEWLLEQPELSRARDLINKLLEKYDEFLLSANASEADLVQLFLNKQTASDYMKNASAFGDSMFEALCEIGQGGRLHRLIVV
jgi:predicted nucleotidyltransferase